jgi:hypothetical protein
VKHQIVTVVLALVFVALAAIVGPWRKAAMIGAATSGFTALGSILWIGRTAKGSPNAQKKVLLVFALVFLLRILLVALGTALVVRAGENVWAFVLAFFVPYFVFSAVEAAYLSSLRGHKGTTA